MPLLLPKMENSYQTVLSESGETDQLETRTDSCTIEKSNTDAGGIVIQLDHQDSVDNGNAQITEVDEDVFDGPLPLEKELSSSVSFPDLAKERLIDGIKEVLEEQSQSQMQRVASMDYNTSL